jgi:UDP-N-acetylglucosamine--N-acetylmuramyl-(pentapeptide) pyrophosphoryl-undecaprenol N-acetylglucosamine transferase
VLADAGAALMLPQSELSAERLGRAIDGLLSEDGTRGVMANKARMRGKPEAAAEIVSNLLTLVR